MVAAGEERRARVHDQATLGRAFGGGVALGFGATFFQAAQDELDELCGLQFARGARIVSAKLGDAGPLVGAGAIGWRGMRRAGISID